MTRTTTRTASRKSRRIVATLQSAALLAAAVEPYADGLSDDVREALTRLDECFAAIGADELRRPHGG